MTLTGERIDASEAHRIGPVSDVVATGSLAEEAERIATRVSVNPPLGVQSAKEATLRSIGRTLEDALHLEHMFFASLAKTEDYVEGPRAFAEKRDPDFKGR